MRVSVFGLGHVGCVTAARLAEAGHKVIGVDVNGEKVARVNSGLSPIVEPGLGDLLGRVKATGHLRATCSCEEAVAASDLALICVGTPTQSNGRMSAESLARVCRGIGNVLGATRKPYTVVVRSTVMPGTTAEVIVPALRAGIGNGERPDVKVAVNPEFMREGSALRDFNSPPFTLVGCEDKPTSWQLRELYDKVDAQFVHTSVRTAEMLKYASNAFHALKVCFANEIGDLCEAMRVDAREVMRVFCLDHKLNLSDAYLKPGFAFGGSCLPKDIRALNHAARAADVDTPVLATLLPANVARIRAAAATILATRRRRIGVVGLAFKSGTDDLRESPIVAVVECLIGKGLQVRILDHNVAVARLTGANGRYIEGAIPHISSLMCESAEELLEHAEVLLIGNADEQSEAVVGAARPGQVIVDLTRSLRARPVFAAADGSECVSVPIEPVSPRPALPLVH
ncbi:MAG: nucleotide sugar dehydrogenase [Steroidobacteraceae bacterium]|jgi:GDP-mannose 6-dehydrogenase